MARALAAVFLVEAHWAPAFVLIALSALVDGGPSGSALNFGRRRSLPVGPLMTLPAPATPFPCVVEIRKAGTLLGTDVGVVSFLDGWLQYEGWRTSFSLRREDVERRTDDRLLLREGGGIVFLPNDLLTVGEHEERGLARRFRADLASWMRSESPQGESILPPATPTLRASWGRESTSHCALG